MRSQRPSPLAGGWLHVSRRGPSQSRRWWPTALLVLTVGVLASLGAACGRTPKDDRVDIVDTQSDGAADAVTDTQVAADFEIADGTFDVAATVNPNGSITGPSGELLGWVIPAAVCADKAGDSDGDGILNAYEDRNLNCIRELDESDPRDADTDGDGLDDGEEYLLWEGGWESGRGGDCDPTNPDTDGDGVLDGLDPDCVGSAPSCTRALFDEIAESPAPHAKSNLALPAGYRITSVSEATGAVFADPTAKAFGFVTLRPSTGNAAGDLGSAFAAVAGAGYPPTLIFAKDFVLPDPAWTRLQVMPLDATTGRRGDYEFVTDGREGAAHLRDTALAAVAGVAVASGDSSAACIHVRSNWIVMLRPDAQVVITAIFSCSDDFDASEAIQFAFEDVFGGTIIAPGGYGANDYLCEALTPSVQGILDFVWVIDNSGSMADEQVKVADTAAKFMATLGASGVDWRVAVTTTEVYTLTDTNPSTAHDELIDQATGLRGVGFLSANNPNADALFGEYVAFDGGCALGGQRPVGWGRAKRCLAAGAESWSRTAWPARTARACSRPGRGPRP